MDTVDPELTDCVVCEPNGLLVRVENKTLLLPNPVDETTYTEPGLYVVSEFVEVIPLFILKLVVLV